MKHYDDRSDIGPDGVSKYEHRIRKAKMLNGGWQWAKRWQVVGGIIGSLAGVATGVYWMGFRTANAVQWFEEAVTQQESYEARNDMAHSEIFGQLTTQSVRFQNVLTAIDSVARKQNTVICVLGALAEDQPVPRTCGLR